MLRKKILLLGLGQDKTAFLAQLKPVQGERHVYKIGSQQVVIERTVEQIYPDHICSENLDGFDAVIQLFNANDSKAPDLQIRIPDAVSSYVKVLEVDNETPAEFISKVLNEITDKKAYRHQDPIVSSPSIASLFASFFCFPQKAKAACPVNHVSNEPFEPSALSYVISSK